MAPRPYLFSVPPAPLQASLAWSVVVEREAGVRDTLKTLLQDAGLLACTFASGDDFLAYLHTQPRLNLIICELDEPTISGLTVLQKLRAANYATPVIMLENESNVPRAVDAIRAGAADVMEKPLINRCLMNRVEELLERPAAGTR